MRRPSDEYWCIRHTDGRYIPGTFRRTKVDCVRAWDKLHTDKHGVTVPRGQRGKCYSCVRVRLIDLTTTKEKLK